MDPKFVFIVTLKLDQLGGGRCTIGKILTQGIQCQWSHLISSPDSRKIRQKIVEKMKTSIRNVGLTYIVRS